MARERKKAPTHTPGGLPVETPTEAMTIRRTSREWLAIRVVAEIRRVTPAELYRTVPMADILRVYTTLVQSAQSLGW